VHINLIEFSSDELSVFAWVLLKCARNVLLLASFHHYSQHVAHQTDVSNFDNLSVCKTHTAVCLN
jgi:hypothetical protein